MRSFSHKPKLAPANNGTQTTGTEEDEQAGSHELGDTLRF